MTTDLNGPAPVTDKIAEQAARLWTKLKNRRQVRAKALLDALTALGGTADYIAISRRAGFRPSEFQNIKTDAYIGAAMGKRRLVRIIGTDPSIFTFDPTVDDLDAWVAWSEKYLRTRSRNVKVTKG